MVVHYMIITPDDPTNLDRDSALIRSLKQGKPVERRWRKISDLQPKWTAKAAGLPESVVDDDYLYSNILKPTRLRAKIVFPCAQHFVQRYKLSKSDKQ